MFFTNSIKKQLDVKFEITGKSLQTLVNTCIKQANKIERLEKFVTLLVQLNRGNAEQSFHALQFNKDSAITEHVVKETLYNEKG